MTRLFLDNGMLHIGKRMPADALMVWEVITDTSLWPHWGPSVRRVACPRRCIRQGTSGRILTQVGIWLPFTVTEYRWLQHWSWRVCGLAATGHTISERGPGFCTLAFSVPWWAAFYLPVCYLALLRIERLLRRSVTTMRPSILPNST